jgi:hypothetical protein
MVKTYYSLGCQYKTTGQPLSNLEGEFVGRVPDTTRQASVLQKASDSHDLYTPFHGLHAGQQATHNSLAKASLARAAHPGDHKLASLDHQLVGCENDYRLRTSAL